MDVMISEASHHDAPTRIHALEYRIGVYLKYF